MANVTTDIVTAICCGKAKNAISHFAPMDVLIEGVANSAAANAILILPGLIVASRFARRDARDMAAA